MGIGTGPIAAGRPSAYSGLHLQEAPMNLRSLGFTAVATGALALSGCATYPYDSYAVYEQPRVVYERPVPMAAAPVYGPTYGPRAEYGVVEYIELYRDGSNAPVGIGTILGGVAGGVIGHQIGAG